MNILTRAEGKYRRRVSSLFTWGWMLFLFKRVDATFGSSSWTICPSKLSDCRMYNICQYALRLRSTIINSRIVTFVESDSVSISRERHIRSTHRDRLKLPPAASRLLPVNSISRVIELEGTIDATIARYTTPIKSTVLPMKLALVSALSFRRALVFGLQPFDRDTPPKTQHRNDLTVYLE